MVPQGSKSEDEQQARLSLQDLSWHIGRSEWCFYSPMVLHHVLLYSVDGSSHKATQIQWKGACRPPPNEKIKVHIAMSQKQTLLGTEKTKINKLQQIQIRMLGPKKNQSTVQESTSWNTLNHYQRSSTVNECFQGLFYGLDIWCLPRVPVLIQKCLGVKWFNYAMCNLLSGLIP